VTDLGALTAVVTGLLYYFGWVRTRHQAYRLGYDASVMDLSIADYVLKSLNVLFAPLTVLLIGALLLYAAHRRFVRPPTMSAARRSATLKAGRMLGRAWILWVLVAAVLLPTPMGGYALPVSLTLAVIFALYGRALRLHIAGVDPWPTVTRVLVLVLLAIGTFWTTERVAQTMGRAFADDFVARPDELAAVTLYSAKDLQIESSGVVKRPVSSPDSQYSYKYTGLRLIERSGDKYFFITSQPGQVIVIRESDSVRMDFTK